MESNGRLRQSRGKILLIVAATSVFGLALCTFSSKIILASEASDLSGALITHPNADTQIASLLTRIEQALLENEAAPSDEIVKMLVSALELLPGSSAEGRRLMTEFPTRLTKRAAEERASGHREKAVYISAFADASAILTQPDMKQADSKRGQDAMLADPVPYQESAGDRRQPEEPKPADVPAGSTRGAEKADAGASTASGSFAASESGDGRFPNTETREWQVLNQIPVPPLISGAAEVTRDDVRDHQPVTSQAPLSPAAAPIAGPVQTPMVPPATAHGTTRGTDIPETQFVLPLLSLSSSAQQDLLSRGESMLGLGDIVAARMLFAHAASSGVAVAALKVGDTYNPGVLAGLNLHNMKADAGTAEAWYRKAQALGDPQAEERLETLQGHQ